MSEPRDAKVTRRDVLKLTVGGGAGLAVGGLLDWTAVKVAARELKLSEVAEFSTSCNFCSCGCGMIAQVRNGKLIALEGDYDHVVNGGSLCVKGMSMFATHASPKRNQVPLYRAPGSDQWEEITWQQAVDRIAQKIVKTRNENWIARRPSAARTCRSTARTRSRSWAARRTPTRNATCSRRRCGCSAPPTSNTRPDFDIAPPSPVWGQHSGAAR